MADEKSILELSERIVREFQPERIILFGSRARFLRPCRVRGGVRLLSAR
jgi:hypothetical protein